MTPKAHAIEDHLLQQVTHLKGIGDLGEDFLEQSHQDGIRDYARSKNSKREHAALLHSKWEQCLHPGLRDTLDEIKQNSVRMKRSKVGEEEPVSKLMERN